MGRNRDTFVPRRPVSGCWWVRGPLRFLSGIERPGNTGVRTACAWAPSELQDEAAASRGAWKATHRPAAPTPRPLRPGRLRQGPGRGRRQVCCCSPHRRSRPVTLGEVEPGWGSARPGPPRPASRETLWTTFDAQRPAFQRGDARAARALAAEGRETRP